MVVITVIIFSGAQRKENSNICPCQFPHITCILRGYRILPSWLLEIWCKDMSLFFFFFWCPAVTGVNAAKIKPQEASVLSLRKKSFESKKIFSIQVCRRIILFSFGREPEEYNAVLRALGSWCQPWCWPAMDARLLLKQFFEGRKEAV